MAENKTKATDHSVVVFIKSIADEGVRADCVALRDLMARVTGHEAKMWGGAIVGFGSHHYKYESGREGDSMIVGFAPRKHKFALYGLRKAPDYEALVEKLGKFSTGKGCLYIKRLSDVDKDTLAKLIEGAAKHTRENHAS